MKKIALFWTLLICCHCFAQSIYQGKINIIPEPVSVKVQPGFFTLKPDTKIFYDNGQIKDVSKLFIQMLIVGLLP